MVMLAGLMELSQTMRKFNLSMGWWWEKDARARGFKRAALNFAFSWKRGGVARRCTLGKLPL
jgi:hypothetical protein